MKTSKTSSSAIFALLLLAIGCGGRVRTVPPPATDVTRPDATPAVQGVETGKPAVDGDVRLPGQDRSYPSEDPRNRPQSDALALAPAPPAPAPSTSPGGAPGGPSSPASGDLDVPRGRPAQSDFGPPAVPPGESRFRVQILASVAFNAALSARDEVAKVVEEPVYLEREQEIWKVRVGDLPDRATADGIRRRLVGLGYDDAFVVEARGR